MHTNVNQHLKLNKAWEGVWLGWVMGVVFIESLSHNGQGPFGCGGVKDWSMIPYHPWCWYRTEALSQLIQWCLDQECSERTLQTDSHSSLVFLFLCSYLYEPEQMVHTNIVHANYSNCSLWIYMYMYSHCLIGISISCILRSSFAIKHVWICSILKDWLF